MKRLAALISVVLLVLCVATTLPAREAEAAAMPDTSIWFVSVGPGSEVYELEGHSGIAVYISGEYPLVYHYGLYDFNRPNFIYHFVKGETDYMAGAWPADFFFDEYLRAGRRTVARELELNPSQKARLVQLLKENVKPENATYRYNYVKDNCATRPIKVIEEALGDSIHFAPAPFESNSSVPITFRNIMRHYHRNYPWYQFGIDLALGSGIDYPLSRREIAFAPTELDAMLIGAKVGGRPLLTGRSSVVVDVPEDNVVAGPTPWYFTPIFICSLVFVLSLLLTVRDLRRGRLSRLFDAVLFGVYGLAGCLLTFLIFVSVHEATSPNWLYLWLNPLCLLAPALLWCWRLWWLLRGYQAINFAVLVVGLGIWPFLPQSTNIAFLPLVLAEMLRSCVEIRLLKRG